MVQVRSKGKNEYKCNLKEMKIGTVSAVRVNLGCKHSNERKSGYVHSKGEEKVIADSIQKNKKLRTIAYKG
jgi:hypothetical protein